MASDELARKLQSRLAATCAGEPDQDSQQHQPPQSPVRPRTPMDSPSHHPNQGASGGGGDGGDSPSELSAKLNRRLDINDGNAAPCLSRVFNPYTEFKEFSRKQIKDMEGMFKRYDTGRDGFIDLMELKLMMEKLGAPQTHLGLKNMIKEVDEDFDGKLSFREFLLIFRRAAAGELQEESGLMALARLSEINVSTEGVMGAKDFFEAKAQALSQGSKFEAEIREEKEERKRQEEDKKQRRAAFKQLQSAFCS
ncbi:EF-hand domain-containing protein D1 [Periophthalmus magnuspinnatus]|uniref:EF-hand domain-containing protein D1 n=1 Tax=Periophthalmus magnuspinnatus TaxID=409849 RepID=UPI00145BB9EF|nr:EF-hand domain-containing protein D1 [Periophthalmus magnuspinnatus]